VEKLRRVNTGSRRSGLTSPGGTVEFGEIESFSRSFGTRRISEPYPVLKRRAIVSHPFGMRAAPEKLPRALLITPENPEQLGLA
jgi:hypothetical protein